MPRYYILKEQHNNLVYDDLAVLPSAAGARLLDNELRVRILKLLSQSPRYPAEIAKHLAIHEQTVYYHIKQLENAGLITLHEKREVRGTLAKRYTATHLNVAVTLQPAWREASTLLRQDRDSKLLSFLTPFITSGSLDSTVVVGSPDQHGPHKARARDGHYAIDLALFLGRFCSSASKFAVRLDVDVNLKTMEGNYILVGGPVTNLVMQKVNDFLPAKFSEERPWGIKARDSYTEDSVGLIARVPNPYHPRCMVLVLAGIRFSGTKAAVIALTRFTDAVLHRFTGQKEFYCIVEGFDLDGDGKIDSAEIVEP